MKYIVSNNEINRRKIAFTTLSASLIIGLVLASLISNFPIPIGVYLCFVIVLFVSNILLRKSFKSILRNTITLSNKELERTSKNVHEVYLLSNINKVKIKTTTKGTIREIYVWFRNGESMFINGLENFEEFQNNLLIKIDNKVTVNKTTEPIDFDHPLFYLTLGPLISFVCVFFIKTVVNLDVLNIKLMSYAFLIYVLMVGIYFIYSKPIATRYGKEKKTADYIFGLIMICTVICFLVSLLYFF